MVHGAGFTLADLTVGWVGKHAVQVKGEKGANGARFLNVAFVDAGQQVRVIKVTGNVVVVRAIE